MNVDIRHVSDVIDSITDKICVLGIVDVKVVGHVHAGQRIFASVQFPGKAIGETHPVRDLANKRLIGIALATSPLDSNPNELHLVKCFVSFLLGITSEYVNDKTIEVKSLVQRDIEKHTSRKINCK